MTYDCITIEPVQGNRCSFFAAYGHDTYPASSVLAGTPRRVMLEAFETVDAAKRRFPNAEVLDQSTKPFRTGNESLADLSGLPRSEPDWFDPADAGERWDDDY